MDLNNFTEQSREAPPAPGRDPLSRKLIAGEITDGNHVTVDFKAGELVFQSNPLEKAA